MLKFHFLVLIAVLTAEPLVMEPATTAANLAVAATNAGSVSGNVGARASVRLVDELSYPRAVASITLAPSHGVFVVNIKRSAVSAGLLGAALKTLPQFESQRSKYPSANISIYLYDQPLERKVAASDRARLERLVLQLRALPAGSSLEVVEG
jgi:hypothetical protein